MIRTSAIAIAISLGWTPALAQQVLGGPNIAAKPPANSIGNEANWYIDWNSGLVYGPKTLGQWPPLASYSLGNSGPTAPNVFYALSFPAGGCSWSQTGDAGPCINAAINAAVTNGGGTVVLPPHPPTSWWGIQTLLTPIQTPAIKLVGAGVGPMPNRATAPNFVPNCATRLKWIGPVSSGPMLDIESPGDPAAMYGNDVRGICFDGNWSLHTIARMASVGFASFDIGLINRLEIGLDFSTLNTPNTSAANTGTQYTTGRFFDYCDSIPANFAAQSIGMLVRSDPNSMPDVSLDQFDTFYSNCGAGNPMVMVNGDTTKFFSWVTYRGGPIIIANSNYVLPLGLQTRTTYPAESIDIERSAAPIWIQGLQTGDVMTPVSVAGTAGPTTITTTTTATAFMAAGLGVASTAGIAAGYTITLGAPDTTPNVGNNSWGAGLPANSTITLIAGSTLRFDQWIPFQSGVAAGVPVTVSWGFTNLATGGFGPYTLKYVAATSSYTLTPPTTSGGQTVQTGVKPTAVAGGGNGLFFNYLSIPWNVGAPVDGDTWTFSTPLTSPGFVHVWRVAAPRGAWIVAPPQWEVQSPGRGGCWGDEYGPPCEYSAPYGSRIIGDPGNNALGQYAVSVGGQTNNANGLNSVAVGGSGNSLTGTGAVSVGSRQATVDGNNSVALGGQGGTTRGRQYCRFTSGNNFAVAGDAQHIECILRNFRSSAGNVRLTADGTPATLANSFGLVPNMAAAIGVSLSCIDNTNPANAFSAVWGTTTGPHILAEGATPATTLLDGATAAVAPDQSRTVGTIPGITASLAPDTTLGALNVTVTLPSGDIDRFNCTAWVTANENM